MLLKMKTSMGGPTYSVTCGQELPFDDAFPFSPDEVRRFISPEHDIAEYVGDVAALEAWLGEAGVALVPALLGSSVLPAIVEVGGYHIHLGGIVCAAFDYFAKQLPPGTDEVAAATAWNDRAESEREDALALLVNLLDAEPGKIPEMIAETSIVARPQSAPTVEAKPSADETKPAGDAAKAEAAPAAKPAAAKAAAKKG